MTPSTDCPTAPDRNRRFWGKGVLAFTLLLAAAAIVVPAAPAQAVPPGANGLIVYADNYDIKTVRPDGSDEQNLTAGRDPFAQYPRWSPDGAQISFQKSAGPATQGCPAPNFVALMVMNADGSNEREITRSDSVESTWSPDGSRIAFTRCGNIFAVSPQGGAETQLTLYPTSSNVEFPDWSPDGRQIAYVLCGGGCQIHVINVDGSGDTTITQDGELNLFPRWSPDGARLAFMSNRDPAPYAYEHIWTMRADGSDPIRITDGMYDQYPTWSPDGGQIVYTQGTTNLEVGGLRSVAPDGTGNVLLKVGSSSNLPAPYAADWQSISQRDAVAPVVTVNSPQQDAVYNLADPVPAAYSCTDDGGSGLTSCTAPVPDGAAIDTATIGAKTFTVTATDGAGNQTVSTAGYSVDAAGYADPDTGTTVSAGAPTLESPATADVVVPPGTAGGAVTIGAYDVSTPEPTGYQLLDRQLHIDAPSATWDNPLRLTFALDPSLLPASTTAADVAVFRDGALLADCPSGATTALPPDGANPDGSPCVIDRQTRPDGAAALSVLTPHASEWNFGATVVATPTIDSVTPSSRGVGARNQTIVITGTGFAPGATASISGTGVTILAQTVVSPTELRLRVSITNRAVTGSRTLTVSNAPGAEASIGFTVNPPPRPLGAPPVPPGHTTTITISGSGFVPGRGLRVVVQGQGITVGAVVAATTTSITVQVTVGPSVPNGSYLLVVQNPDGGRGSCRCLTVASP